MKVSEKSLELNIGAEILGIIREQWGMPRVYLRGLTQLEERQEGVDFFAELDPAARLFAFQFKAPKGTVESLPYRYALVSYQHNALFQLAQFSANSVFYVFPFYVTTAKLQQDVPVLAQDTWLLGVDPMQPAQVFRGAQTKVVRCQDGQAAINPEYRLQPLKHVPQGTMVGIRPQEFARWYRHYRAQHGRRTSRRRSPWLARGLRIAIVMP